jgi:hypothetical protein
MLALASASLCAFWKPGGRGKLAAQQLVKHGMGGTLHAYYVCKVPFQTAWRWRRGIT